MENDINTAEQNILTAARKVFVSKGFDGARMQEIANEAGINKALVHYYFRSKDKLFEAVFTKAFNEVKANVSDLIDSDKPLLQKLDIFIDNYMDVLLKNPDLPAFVAHELNRNPDRIYSVIFGSGFNPMKLTFELASESAKGIIRPIAPQHLMVNIISLCIFPFVVRPLMGKIIFSDNQEAMDSFLQERKIEVKKFVFWAISL